MKRGWMLAALFFAAMGMKLHAQVDSANVKKTPAVTARKRVFPSPLSVRPSRVARPSTAEAGPAHAGWKPQQGLPSLPLADRDGKAAQVSALSTGSRHWLLLYRTATCIPCDRVMLTLQGSNSPELKAGKPLVIVVDSPKPDALEQVHAGFTGFADATWVADRTRATAATLKLHGSPVLIAMDGNRVAWRVAGSLDSTDTLLRMTNAWLAQNSSPADHAPTVPWAQANRAAQAASAIGRSSAPQQ